MKTDKPVALVNMPFYGLRTPSIQIGLLKALLSRCGVGCDGIDFNLHFAHRIGRAAYEVLASEQTRSLMLGEWIFGLAAFGGSPDNGYLERFRPGLESLCQHLGGGYEFLLEIRHKVAPDFIRWCLEAIPWSHYKIVGFTSTFQQTVASLAMARALKCAHPDITIVFGGANFDEPMGPEFVRAFPWVDCVVVGEGDEVFPELVKTILSGKTVKPAPGLALREGGEVLFIGRAPLFHELASNPVPDYDDFFNLIEELDFVPEGGVVIPFESSRGCWWGEKNRCVFCGGSEKGIGYRVKPPAAVIAELGYQARRYGVLEFEATDRIMGINYIRELFGQLARERLDFRLFHEVRANLSREDLRMLRNGGAVHLQPGLESLNTHILHLMGKGIQCLQNLVVLKWGRYYGLRISWNILMGFPGETREDYRRQLEILQAIPHLEPPITAGRIWLERGSPHFSQPDRFPVRDVHPQAAYYYIYPGHQVDIRKISCFFDYRMEGTLPDEEYAATQEYVREWQRRWEGSQPPTLTLARARGELFLVDARDGEPVIYRYEGPSAEIYDACSNKPCSLRMLEEHLTKSYPGCSVGRDEIAATLEEFVRERLMIHEDGKFFSLAVPANRQFLE